MTPSPDTPDEPYDFLASFQRACEETGQGNYAYLFDYYFSHHYVFKGPTYLLLGEEDPDDSEAWFIYWAETRPHLPPTDMVRLFFSLVPYPKPRIAWCRYIKGRPTKRYFLTERLLRLSSGPHNVLWPLQNPADHGRSTGTASCSSSGCSLVGYSADPVRGFSVDSTPPPRALP
jgi:hypothetical protein